MTKQINQLMGTSELIKAIWSDGTKKSQDWIRVQARAYLKDKKTGIPCRKVFGRILFDEQEVRKRLGLDGGGK